MPVPDGSLLTGPARDEYSQQLFNEIAPGYDRLNRVISLGGDQRWRRELVAWAGLKAGDAAVDLGTGTGDLFLLLAEAVGEAGRVVGIDVAENMLALAREKAAVVHPARTHELRCGTADRTGLEDASVDAVTMGWSLRNVGDRGAVYAEVLRILKPGGRLLVVESSRPENLLLRAGSTLYMRLAMPLLVRLTGGTTSAYNYLTRSTELFPGKRALAEEMRAAGFGKVEYRGRMLGAIALHRAEKRPA